MRQVHDGRAVLVANLHLHDDRLVLVGDDAHGQSVGGCQKRICHVASVEAAADGIALDVVSHDGHSLRMPVVLHGVLVHILAVAHDVLGLLGKLSEHHGVGALKLHLDGMGGADAEVVVSETDVSVGILGAKLWTQFGDGCLHGLEVLAFHDEFAVVLASAVHGTHEAVADRRGTHRCRHAVNLLVLQQLLGERQQVVPCAVGAALWRQVVFDDELPVVEVGEEHSSQLREAPSAQAKQGDGADDGQAFVVDERGYQASYGFLHLVVAHVFARLVLHSQRQPCGDAGRHLYHSQHPGSQKRDAEHEEEVAAVFACRVGREVGGQERQHGDDGGAQHGQRRVVDDVVEIAFGRESSLAVGQDAV